MASPVFTENSPFVKGAGPNTGTDVMTFENTMSKTVMLFLLTIATMAVGWIFLPIGLAVVCAIAALVLSLIIAFKKEVPPAMYIATTGIYGLAVGAISGYLETIYPGVVIQAVIGTLTIIAVVFGLYRSGRFRSSPKMTKFFVAAMLGYLAFSLVNAGLMLTGLNDQPWGMRSVEIAGIPLGVILGIFAILMGAYSLILDFEFIENGIALRIPSKYGWDASFGLVSTVVWIYIELLRLLSILRN